MKTVYDTTTGKILGHYYSESPDGTVSLGEDYPSQGLIEGMFSWKDYYIDVENEIALPKPQIPDPVATLVDTYTFNDLPTGAQATILDVELNSVLAVLNEESGVITFTLEDAGQYKITVTAPFPYLSKEIYLEVS